MAERPSFEQVKTTVLNEVIRATSDYALIKMFFFSLLNQPMLMEHYPALVEQLYLAVTGNIVMALSRLFEAREDDRKASLITFLNHVGQLPRPEGEPTRTTTRQNEYWENIKAFMKDIETVEKCLVWYRNAYLAHNDLTKAGRVDIKWEDVATFIEVAQNIVKKYYLAFEETDQRFEIANLGWEPRLFLEWCRLDNYAKHRQDEMEARKREFRRRMDQISRRGETT